MDNDLRPIMDEWEYSSNDINVRLIDGLDGKQKVQMRLDLGLLQMELDGRPDGQKPKGFDTYFSYSKHKVSKFKPNKNKKRFHLSSIDGLNLQQEAIQYYHRYLALMKLKDYPRVARDTQRNLDVFDFVMQNSDNDEIVWTFQQYRPYVIMMNTRALVCMCLDKSNHDEAIGYINKGIKDIQSFNDDNQSKVDEDHFELEFLQQWLREIKNNKPLSKKDRLMKELENAIEKEEYERAAVLRDKLEAMFKDKSDIPGQKSSSK